MANPDEDAFVRTIEAYPADCAPRLVFADWLEEREDKRHLWVRESAAYLARDQASNGWPGDPNSIYELSKGPNNPFDPFLGCICTPTAPMSIMSRGGNTSWNYTFTIDTSELHRAYLVHEPRDVRISSNGAPYLNALPLFGRAANQILFREERIDRVHLRLRVTLQFSDPPRGIFTVHNPWPGHTTYLHAQPIYSLRNARSIDVASKWRFLQKAKFVPLPKPDYYPPIPRRNWGKIPQGTAIRLKHPVPVEWIVDAETSESGIMDSLTGERTYEVKRTEWSDVYFVVGVELDPMGSVSGLRIVPLERFETGPLVTLDEQTYRQVPRQVPEVYFA